MIFNPDDQTTEFDGQTRNRTIIKSITKYIHGFIPRKRSYIVKISHVLSSRLLPFSLSVDSKALFLNSWTLD